MQRQQGGHTKRTFDITRRVALAERTEVLRRALQLNDLILIDGIVQRHRRTGLVVSRTLWRKAAIYEWVVETPSTTRFAKASPAGISETCLTAATSPDAAETLRNYRCRLVLLYRHSARPVFGLRMDCAHGCLAASAPTVT